MLITHNFHLGNILTIAATTLVDLAFVLYSRKFIFYIFFKFLNALKRKILFYNLIL